MKNNQQRYIEYVMKFAEENKSHIWLSGSFLHKTATEFSDIDISVFCNTENLNKLIYGYGKPIYISYTHNPIGILIVIYEDGVAVDLEIIEQMNITDDEFFHTDDIKILGYQRNEKICKEISLKDDMFYQASRLFHRSLIKFLSGKQDMSVNIANEIAGFINCNISVDKTHYHSCIVDLLKLYNEQYQLPLQYVSLLFELIEELDEGNYK